MRHSLLIVFALVMSGAAHANGSSFPSAVKDVTIGNTIPAQIISVRNTANSTDPADRKLRVTSQDPNIATSGLLKCKSFANSGQAKVHSVRSIVASVNVDSVDGFETFGLGKSGPIIFEQDTGSIGYQLTAKLSVPKQGSNALINLGFNPVNFVESRMKTFVANGAGTEADFMKTDHVFDTELSVAVIGRCQHNFGGGNKVYAGFRSRTFSVKIFYKADEDIRDAITAIDGVNAIDDPKPKRAKPKAKTRQSETAPPARREKSDPEE